MWVKCVSQRLNKTHLGAPEFHRPVEGGGDEEVGEVDGTSGTVAAQASDWTVMTLKHLGDACLTATQSIFDGHGSLPECAERYQWILQQRESAKGL